LPKTKTKITANIAKSRTRSAAPSPTKPVENGKAKKDAKLTTSKKFVDNTPKCAECNEGKIVKNRLVQCKGVCGRWYHSRGKCGNIKPDQDEKWTCPNCPVSESEAEEEADAEDESDVDVDGEEYGSVEEPVAGDAEDGKPEDGGTEHSVNSKNSTPNINKKEIKKELFNDAVGDFAEDDEEDVKSPPDNSGTDPDYSDGEATDATSASGRSVKKEHTVRRFKVEYPIKGENIVNEVAVFHPAQIATKYRTPKVIQDNCRVDRLLKNMTRAEQFQKEREHCITFRRCQTLSPFAGGGQTMPGSWKINGDKPMTD
jgi:hypothetical protein